MYFLGAILAIAGAIWMTVNAAKKDGALAAILTFICGFYLIYYGIKNWAENKVPFLIWVAGVIVMVAFMPSRSALGAY